MMPKGKLKELWDQTVSRVRLGAGGLLSDPKATNPAIPTQIDSDWEKEAARPRIQRPDYGKLTGPAKTVQDERKRIESGSDDTRGAGAIIE